MGCVQGKAQSTQAQKGNDSGPTLMGNAGPNLGNKDVNLGELLFNLLRTYTAPPVFEDLLAKYYTQVGTNGISASGDNTFHSVFYDDKTAQAESIVLGGTSHDVKLLELATTLFGVGCKISSSKRFSNLGSTEKAVQNWLDSTNVGFYHHETERLLVDVWLQAIFNTLKENPLVKDYTTSRWNDEMRAMWAIDPETKESAWLPISDFKTDPHNPLAMLLLIAMTKLFCCDLSPSKEDTKYVGYDAMDGTSSSPLPGGTVVITDSAFSANGPGRIDVDSNVIDPDFAIDIWRPSSTNESEFHHVCRVDMPLVVGRNQRVFHEFQYERQAGDVLGWYSPNQIDLKYKSEAGISVKSLGGCDFKPDSKVYNVKVDMSDGAVYDRGYSVRVLERTQFWDDVQAAVKSVYQTDELTEQHLSIAKRTYFTSDNLRATLDYEQLKRSLDTESLQSLIDGKCNRGPTQVSATEWKKGHCYKVPNELDKICTYTRTVTNEYGQDVRRWISANQTTFLRDVIVSTWVNTEQKDESEQRDGPMLSEHNTEVKVESSEQAQQWRQARKKSRATLDTFWQMLGPDSEFNMYLADKPDDVWAKLSLRVAPTRQVRLRCKVDEFDPAYFVATNETVRVVNGELQFFCEIDDGAGMSVLTDKNCILATFDDKYTSLSGNLLVSNDVVDPNPVAIVGQRLEAVTSRTASWFPGCCVSSAGVAHTTGTREMSAANLFDLIPPNIETVTNNIMTDIMQAAYATYKQEWVDDVQLQDLVARYQQDGVPDSMTDMVKEDDVQQMLWDLVTAQVSGSVWDKSVEHYWNPEFTSQQDVRNRAHYFLEGRDETCMVGKATFSKTFNRLRDHWYGKRFADLAPYMQGEGGKTAVQWAWELAEYTFSDEAQGDLQDLLTTDPSDGEIAKLQHIISALTANSSDEQDQLLSLNFTNTLSKAFLNYCVEYIGSLDVDAMTDMISMTLHEIWKTTQSPPKDLPDAPEVVSALKSSFKIMGVESDSDIDTKLKKYTGDLAQHFVDNAETMPKIYNKISYWNDQLKTDFPQLSTEEFNQVTSFSTFLITSVSTTVAAYSTTHKSDANWILEKQEDRDRYIGIGVLVMNKALRYTPGIENLWRTPTPDWWREARASRVFAIIEAADEMRRPQMAFNEAHVDWQRYLENNLLRYADELEAARNEVEAQRVWLHGQVNFLIGDTARTAANIVCSSLTMATAIYALSQNPNDPWSIKAWEVAQIAVDSLGLLTDGYIVAASDPFNWGIELAVADSIPILGEIFAVAGAAIAVVLIILQSSKLSPEQLWVRDVGKQLLTTVNPPPSDWLEKHPLPKDVQ